jgi:hypothetical protein
MFGSAERTLHQSSDPVPAQPRAHTVLGAAVFELSRIRRFLPGVVVIRIFSVEFLLFRRPVVAHPSSVMAPAPPPRIQPGGAAFDAPATWCLPRSRQRRRRSAGRRRPADHARQRGRVGIRNGLVGYPAMPFDPLIFGPCHVIKRKADRTTRYIPCARDCASFCRRCNFIWVGAISVAHYSTNHMLALYLTRRSRVTTVPAGNSILHGFPVAATGSDSIV